MKKAFMFVVVILTLVFSTSLTFATDYDKENKWLIYWYICGADLEDKDNEATLDMQEMARIKFSSNKALDQGEEKYLEDGVLVNFPRYIPKDIKLSPNVKILIQTGGCYGWANEEIPSNTIGRYLFDSNGFHYQGSFADTDMGDGNTLENFLRYGKNVVEKEFKPNRRMFIFWNHGGLVGVCYDERYPHERIEQDSFLDLNEIRHAFSKVYKASPDNPPFEIIGFDACTRATYENANNIYGFARYMVASEENESGYGWYYSDWISKLSENPSVSAETLSKTICQSSYDYLVENDIADHYDSTFSVINLSKNKWVPLRNAYNSFSKNYNSSLYKNPYLYATLEAAAENAESYGATVDASGNVLSGLMIDLKDFVERTAEHFPEDIDDTLKMQLTESANNLARAVDSAVLYNVCGENKYYSNGISTYYPLVKNEENVVLYTSQNITSKYISEIYNDLVRVPTENYGESSSMPNAPTARGRRPATRNLDEVFNLAKIQNLPIHIDGDNDEVFVDFTQEQKQGELKKVANVSCLVAAIIEDGDESVGIKGDGALILGQSANIKRDWSTGRFTDRFQANWPMLNNNLVLTMVLESRNNKVDSEGVVTKKAYVIYGIPIIINGNPCLLRVTYYPDEQKYQIIGARRASKSIGRTSRGLVTLKKGDTVTPILMALVPAKDNDNPEAVIASFETGDEEIGTVVFKLTPGETFTLAEDPVIENGTLKDGDYNYRFIFSAANGSSAQSEAAVFDVYKGEVLLVDKVEHTPEDNKSVKFNVDDKEYTYDPKTNEYTEES